MSLADIPVDLAALKTGGLVDDHFGLAAHLKSRTAHLVSSNNGLARYAQNINAQGGVRVYGTNDYRPIHPHPNANTNSSRMRYLARDIDNGSLALSAPNRWQGAWNSTMNYKFTPASARLGLGGKSFTWADELVGGGVGFFFDAGWQIAQDWNDPFLTPSVKLIRGGVSGLVGLGSGLVVVAVVGTGLPGFMVAVGVGWIVETPISNWIYQKAGWVPTRDLRSLQNP
ncbi:MAG: hypothetical protein OT477_14085 [Chloroflexi bacterium]|nr:hypothetical protein [Chloroflexota bacterium]